MQYQIIFGIPVLLINCILLFIGEDCGKLLPPENGWMLGSDTSHPSKVLFKCAPGYSRVGSSQRTCLRNGSWSGQQPRCLRKIYCIPLL